MFERLRKILSEIVASVRDPYRMDTLESQMSQAQVESASRISALTSEMEARRALDAAHVYIGQKIIDREFNRDMMRGEASIWQDPQSTPDDLAALADMRPPSPNDLITIEGFEMAPEPCLRMPYGMISVDHFLEQIHDGTIVIPEQARPAQLHEKTSREPNQQTRPSVASRLAEAQHEAERRASEQADHEHPPKERGRD